MHLNGPNDENWGINAQKTEIDSDCVEFASRTKSPTMTTFFFFYQLKCIFRSTSNWRQRQRQQTTELHKNLIDSAAHMNTMIFLYPHPPRRPCAIFIKSVCVCTLSLYPSEHSTVSEIFLLFFFSLFVAVYFIYLNFIDVLVGSLLATRLVAATATATATSQKYARPIK